MLALRLVVKWLLSCWSCWPEQERATILRQHAQLLPLGPSVTLDAIAADCVGYTGADLAALCRQAAMRALTSGCAGVP
jgi:SpoVK/Ycf46/Vps4 family AAA+-type ATPase